MLEQDVIGEIGFDQNPRFRGMRFHKSLISGRSYEVGDVVKFEVETQTKEKNGEVHISYRDVEFRHSHSLLHVWGPEKDGVRVQKITKKRNGWLL